jgi:hypothetical protein
MRARRLAGLVCVLACAAAACRRESLAAEVAVQRTPDVPAAGRLPEDPVAGKRSEAQWQQHMDAEERERQLGYDRRALPQHQAAMRLLAAARARYDRARTKAAVARVKAGMPALRTELRARLDAIDHWRVNSRLLPDYDEAMAALEVAYPDARAAAIDGDARALREARAELDRRTEKMKGWLAAAAASEDE